LRQFCGNVLWEPSDDGAFLQITKTSVNGRLQGWPKALDCKQSG
jgi:hypothetical protein